MPSNFTSTSKTEDLLLANIKRIAAYTAEHTELRNAHHFLYDLRSPPEGIPRFVVMGINPGETELDWEISPQPTEETSRHDFHHRAERGGSSLRWQKLANYYLDGADHVLAELFLWSSHNAIEFRKRYGSLARSPHLSFCQDVNIAILETYRPTAVIFPGLGVAPIAARLYGLSYVGSVKEGSARVVEYYHDGTRPWLFTKHWTGSFGLSHKQRTTIRGIIRSTTGRVSSALVVTSKYK